MVSPERRGEERRGEERRGERRGQGKAADSEWRTMDRCR